jgi:hypothetical protein
MLRQVEAVLMTYTTRRSLWLVFSLALLFIGLPTIGMVSAKHGDDARNTQAALYLLGFAGGGVAYLLLSQAKWQFADPRARVLPGFVRPHLAVTAGIAAIGLILWPLLVAFLGGFNPLGCLACVLAIAIPYLWGTHWSRMAPSIPAFLTFLSLMTEAGRHFWLASDARDQFFVIHGCIVIAAVAVFAIWLVRLAALREEMDDYNIPVHVQSGSATRMERSQTNRNLARHFLKNSLSRSSTDFWHDRLEGRHERSVAGRQRLLRYGFSALPLEVQGLLMTVLMGSTMIVCAYLLRGDSTGGGWSVMPLVLFGTWPALNVSQMLAMRRARMSQELMLPLTRVQYIDGLVSVAATATAIMWLLLHVILGVVVAFSYSQLPAAPMTVLFVATSLCVQPYLFGVNAYTARFQSGTARIVVAMIALFPAMLAAGGVVGLAQINYVGAVAVAILFALVGAWVCQGVRKLWREEELA